MATATLTRDAADSIAAGIETQSPWQVVRREGRWILAAAAIGFAVSAIGAQVLELPRPWIVFVLAIAVGVLTVAYVRNRQLAVGALVSHRWVWAIVRGLALGAVLVVLVLPDDPTPTPGGTTLAASVIWLGVVYGAAEALLVNVVPMMAAWRAFHDAGWTGSMRGKAAAATFTMAANMIVTAAYNLGFPEFRGIEITGPLSGNLLIGAGFVFAPNPIISIISHVILHVASVLAGGDGPVNLPPHYA
jgi:hypothetical protein